MKKYDLIVTGGGLTGVAAAVAAAREGLSVLLIEQSGFYLLNLLGTIRGGVGKFVFTNTKTKRGEEAFFKRSPLPSLSFVTINQNSLLCAEALQSAQRRLRHRAGCRGKGPQICSRKGDPRAVCLRSHPCRRKYRGQGRPADGCPPPYR